MTTSFVHLRRSALAAFAALLFAGAAHAQLSLNSAVDLALKSDPRVKAAQADVEKARASLSEAKAAFVPAITTSGGIGKSVGVPLSLPIIFTVGAQSLAFNFSQPDYIRAAGAGVSAANFALDQVRDDVAADVASTYVALDSAQRRRAALAETSSIVDRLARIQSDRFDAGLEAKIEVTKVRRTAAQTRLQKIVNDGDIEVLSAHLSRLIGLGGVRSETVHASIPAFLPPSDMSDPVGISNGLRAALANAQSKAYVARGDARYKLRPQLALGANYSRISTVGTNYALYYPGFDPTRHTDISYNSLDIGVQVTVPLLDMIHRAKAKGTAADATHARFEVESQRMQFLDGRDKLRVSTGELSARAELAAMDRELAQDQLDAVLVQLQPGTPTADGQPALSPKDEQNARLQERERYLDVLAAELELSKAQVALMGQAGTLTDWLHSASSAASPVSTPIPAAPLSQVQPQP